MLDNFIFDLIGTFPGYNSSLDKTNIKKGYLVRGSQNVYKKNSGTIASRFGLKRRGAVDATQAGVVASYEYKSDIGTVFPLRVCNNKLQFESSLADGVNPLWYDLLETGTLLSPARTLTRFVFDSWYDNTESKDRVLMVRGDGNILHWSGGITKVSGGTVAGGTGAIGTFGVNAAGAGYTVGEYVFIGTGGAVAQVTSINGSGGVIGIMQVSNGYGYTLTTYSTTSSATGSGTTITVLTVNTSGTLTKLDSTTSWAQDGFASVAPNEKKLVINGVEYSYGGGEGTATIYGVTPDPSGIVSGSIAVQSVIVSSTDILSSSVTPVALASNDFISVLKGQLFVGSYKSKTIKISASTFSRYLAFLDFINLGSLITGDPDFTVLDNSATGMTGKDGKMYVSAGSSDWYIITPNVSVPVAFTGNTGSVFIRTDVEKVPGSGQTAAIAHEFIETIGGDIVYLAQDKQLRTFSTASKSIFTKKFPSFSQEINEELANENFTGGHLRSVGDFTYLTAPLSGRHYLYQIRESIDNQGNIVGERIWHAPQIAGISRFADINGIVYGHSNQNPQIYQIWDTNQWHDDSPVDQLSYTSVARFSYGHLNVKGGINRAGLVRFDKMYVEGYISQGSNLYANVYSDYQGSTALQNFTINSIKIPAKFFSGTDPQSLGNSSLGDNPLGDGLVIEPNDQSLLPKFRTIKAINPNDCFEYEVEIYSNEADSRWEIMDFGVNEMQAPQTPNFIITK